MLETVYWHFFLSVFQNPSQSFMLDSRERASCHKERDPDLIRGIGQREGEGKNYEEEVGGWRGFYREEMMSSLLSSDSPLSPTLLPKDPQRRF